MRFAPVVLAFGALMSGSIGGMLVVIRIAGGVAPAPLIGAMLAVSAATLAVTFRVLASAPVAALHSNLARPRADLVDGGRRL